MSSYGARWKAKIGLLRVPNCLLSAVGVIVGMWLAAGPPWNSVAPGAAWLAAPIAAFMIAGAGNVLNDIKDHKLDRAAHPNRPLPSGKITPREAMTFMVILLAIGLFEALVAGGIPLAIFAGINVVLLVIYEEWAKRFGLVGNVIVACLVGSTILFGAFAAAGWPFAPVVVALAGMAILVNVGREILKDIEDQEGDGEFRRPFAAVVGRQPAAALAFTCAFTATVFALWWAKRHAWTILPTMTLGVACIIFVLGAGWAFVDAGRGQRLLKLGMPVAFVAFLV